MHREIISHTAVLLLAFLLVCSGACTAQAKEINAAGALFEQFETVFRTTPALLSAQRNGDGANFTEIPFAHLLTGLRAVDKRLPTQVLGASSAVMVGTKDYQLPSGLGQVRSTFCYVVILRKTGSIDISKNFNKPTVAAVAGHPVWDWSVEMQEFGENDPRPSTLYAAQIGQSYLLISNSLNELQESGRTLTESGNGSRLLTAVRDWRAVNRHPFWGYRRFRHPQSVVEKAAGGVRDIEPTAEALVVMIDLKEQMGVLRLLSAEENDPTPQNLNTTGTIPRLKPLGSRAWQTSFPLTQASPFPHSAFGVLWLFGLGQVI